MSPGLVAGAGEDREAGVARIGWVIAGAPAQGEHRAAGVGHELLMQAGVAETGPRPGSRRVAGRSRHQLSLGAGAGKETAEAAASRLQ
jgi:hypothetical protein